MWQVYDRVEKYAAGGRPFAGGLFWTLAAPEYADYDGFTIYLHQGMSTVLGKDQNPRPYSRQVPS